MQILDHDEVDGVPFIVTQYVDGTDLAAVLARGPLGLRSALVLCAQVARGLGDAHRRGVVHRDVKPANVLVRDLNTPDVHAFVCDFGIARSDATDGRTATGVVAGTWAYLAPERTEGAPATPASDLYALGCLLWACLTGRPPYEGSDVQVALAHVQAPVPQLPGPGPLVAEVNAVLARLLAKDPADRHPDAAAVRAELEQLAQRAPEETVERGPVDAAPAPAGTTAPRAAATQARRRRRLPAAVAAVTGVVLVGGAVATAALVSRDDPDPAPDPVEAEVPVSGDVDGNGYGDVVVQQDRFEHLSPLPTWTLPSNGSFFDAAVRGDGEDGFARAGDVDGDGVPDVVWTDHRSGDPMTVVVVPGDGERWTQQLDLDRTLDISNAATLVADVTGDGLDDLLLGGRPDGGDTFHVAVSDGAGFAEPERWYASDLADGFQWSGDFDGDGTDEVVHWADDGVHTSGVVRVLAADDGRLVEWAHRDLDGTSVNPFIAPWLVGDPDGDGADELVVVNATTRRTFVYEVAGGPIEDPRSWIVNRMPRAEAREHLYGDGVLTRALSDVDGDGDDDLVELLDPADEEIEVQVRLSDGSSFTAPEAWGGFRCGSECEDAFRAVD
ncbi:protein kinase [Nocardioides sp. TF02-7]|nr:protein kinase [Nocardioides sp. TF02-7]